MQKLVVGNFYKAYDDFNIMSLWYCTPMGRMQRVCATRIRGIYAGTYSSAFPAFKSMGIWKFSPIPEDEYKQGYLIDNYVLSYYSLCPILYDWSLVSKSSRTRIVKQEDNLADVTASLFAKGARRIDIFNVVILRKQADRSISIVHDQYARKLGTELLYV